MTSKQYQRRLVRRRLHEKSARERRRLRMGELQAMTTAIEDAPWYRRIVQRLWAALDRRVTR